jgi:hypothetical protein
MRPVRVAALHLGEVKSKSTPKAKATSKAADKSVRPTIEQSQNQNQRQRRRTRVSALHFFGNSFIFGR